MLFSAMTPFLLAIAVDLAVPIVLGAIILQEIGAGKNWRNLIVFALLAVFTLANALFHVQAMRGGYAAQGVGLRLGVATAIMMISAIGGRIIPSFSRNWLARTDSTARPAPPMLRFDKLVLLASLPVLGGWVLHPVGTLTSVAPLAFGAAHLPGWPGGSVTGR